MERLPTILWPLALAVVGCGEGEATRSPSETTMGPAGTTTTGVVTGSDASTSSTTSSDTTDDEADSGSTALGSESTTGGEDLPAPACEDRDELALSSLTFDGIDDHVTMGVAPSLGLATFTLETWVRRDGAGVEAGTGSGGVELVPLVGKGRGENDDTIFNANYAFGFRGNTLAADFEDVASGANHPVIGTTSVTWGTWHHIAATYDGSTWRLYLDGELDQQLQVDATPRADSIQHFALGTAMNSTGTASGRFHGRLDEVRVWNYARSEAQIAGAMHATVLAEPGLVSRWGLDVDDGGAPDTAGDNPGTLVGTEFSTDGAVLDQGQPPVVTVPVIPEPVVLPADAVDISLGIVDPDDDSHVVSVFVRELSTEDDFTIVVLPDTQYYSDVDSPNAGSPDYFSDQTQWVRDNRETYDIRAVIHNGDIVNNGDEAQEWAIADAAMSLLETPEPGLPYGIPYGLSVGNHDQAPTGSDGDTTLFNDVFGVERFADRSYYGGHVGETNDDNWVRVRVGELDIVLVSLKYDTTPDPAVLTWARTVFEAHPDALGILNTHYMLTSGGNFSTQSAAIYETLRATDNVQLMTGGHISAEARRTDVYQGNVIHSMLADYQFDGDGGSGFLRLWEFSPANDELTVRTYSPTLDEWMTGEDSEFTLPVELRGAGDDFAEAASLDPAVGSVVLSVEGLAPGRTYEWYATVGDCHHVVRTPVRRFSTAP
ncbi:MAG: LamG-like jellyroll fold domain-containing protein [Myxococcota bacterium]